VSRISLAFLWHMHQPQYRLAGEQVCLQPWVRLHAARSYYDMVRVLEEFPGVRVTMNLVPTLVEQVGAYAGGGSDLFRELARVPPADLDETQRRFLVDHFFSAQEERLIRSLPRYAELLDHRREARRRRGPADAWRDFTTGDLADLQALFDLAWFGFKAAEDFPEIAALRRRGRNFTPADVLAAHAVQDRILGRLVGLYREAAARGQIEISASPFAHPILPLLIDTDAAREAMPSAVLPPRLLAPDDAGAQIDEALVCLEAAAGTRPRGMWPSEGSLSAAAVALMGAHGVAWAAGDIDVLRASERAGDADPRRPWRIEGPGAGVDLVFRDHELSDRIGFTWARSAPKAAADELLAETRARGAAAGGGEEALVLVALDGENPWEHYPEAGAGFLRAVYGALEADGGATVATRTVSEAIALCPRRGEIKRLRAGSWINADFGIWIGGPEKNRAWTLLGDVRARLAPALRDPARPEADRRAAWISLRAAEGSDWFWWLDGQFESLYRDNFDLLFRSHLKAACGALAIEPPEALDWPVGSGDRRADLVPGAGTLARDPVIDGYETDYFEWYGTVPIDWTALVPASTMQRAVRPLETVRAGVTPGGDLVLRLDPGRKVGPGILAGAHVELLLVRPGSGAREATVTLDDQGDPVAADPPGLKARARKILELVLPAAETAIAPGASVILFVRLRIGGETLALKEIEVRRPDPNRVPQEGGA
jgi:alpha-amylase/alpha-mannosidase (GH57 family)